MIELAREIDLEACLKLVALSDEVHCSENQLQSYIKEKNLLLIKHNQQIIGLIAGRVIVDEAELDYILIHSDFQGYGHAASALNEWHDHLQQQQVVKVFLEVRDGNTGAQRLYQRLSYQEVGRRKNYYQTANGNFDALQLCKELS